MTINLQTSKGSLLTKLVYLSVSVVAISGLYNSINQTNVSLDTAWEELEKYKSLFGELPAVGNGENTASTAGALGVDVNVFLKDVYKYKPPSDVSQQEYDIEEYCGSSPDFEAFFALPGTTVRSRHKEDKIIYDTFFKNNFDEEGTYIELGPFDGLRGANTHFFDKCLKWKGLLLEGNPKHYDKLVANRPNTHRMSFAPSCVQWNDTVTIYTTTFTNAGMSGHAKGYEPDENNNNNIPQMDVPCGPIGPIIEKVFPSQLQLPARVNFFSLDVEGAEKLVLDTIDFSKVQIDVFMINKVNLLCPVDADCEVRNQVRNKMVNELGYDIFSLRSNDVYIHPNYKTNPYKNKKANMN